MVKVRPSRLSGTLARRLATAGISIRRQRTRCHLSQRRADDGGDVQRLRGRDGAVLRGWRDCAATGSASVEALQ
jgi:hypothetical protein